MTEILSEETVLNMLFDPKNKKRKVWTPTVVLDRMGINRSPVPYDKWSKANRLKAKMILQALWQRGIIVRDVKKDTRNSYLAGAELAYRRPQDAHGAYLVPCRVCGALRLCLRCSEGIVAKQCEGCGAE